MFEFIKNIFKPKQRIKVVLSTKEIINKDRAMLNDLYEQEVLHFCDTIKGIVKWWFLSYEIHAVLKRKYNSLGIEVPKEFDKYFYGTLKSKRRHYDRISRRFTLR